MGKWETVRLVDVCDFQGGSQPPKEEWIDKPKDGYIRMLQIRDFTQNRGEKAEYVKQTNRTKTCKADDILIARYGASLGKILNGLSGAYNVAIMKTIPDTTLLIKPYLHKYLLSDKFQYHILNLSSRAAQAGFNKNDLESLEIPLPPLDVQQKIADVLDKASALIELRRAQLNELDLLIKSQFIEMFGNLKTNSMSWDIYPFSYAATIDTKMTNDFSFFANYPHIGIENIEKNSGRILDYKLVKDCNLKSGKYPFDERHLIYSKIRPNLNKVAKPSFKGVCSADAYPILPTPQSNRDYLEIVLRSDFFLDYILSFSSRTNIPKVNKQQLEGFCLPIPPISLQNEFADVVSQVENQKKLLQQSLSKLELNYNSLMQKCFRGEVF